MIKLIKGYEYDNSYDYIKTFSTKTLQSNYFKSLSSITIDENNYIKEHSTSFKVPYSYDFLVSNGVNYILFNNGYKDIFAFVVRKEWVAEEVTRLIIDVDVIQTYMFDFTLNKSFVERKKCSISEITDFDEGLDLGEYIIEGEVLSLEKEHIYFAMFSGIKEQKLTFDTNGNITNVVSVPSPTMKPTTSIDGISYPIYFMQLFEEDLYPEPIFDAISFPGGSVGNQGNMGTKISAPGFRFIKGFEAYAPFAYQDMAGYWTIGYGVTLHGEPNIYNELIKLQPVSEERCAMEGYNLKNNNYVAKILESVKNLGCTKQYQLDALTSLAYNCGIGVVTGTNSLMNAIKINPSDETTIRPIWESFYVTSGGQTAPGLIARRKEECNMFFNKPFEVRDIPKLSQEGSIIGKVTENDGNGWLP